MHAIKSAVCAALLAALVTPSASADPGCRHVSIKSQHSRTFVAAEPTLGQGILRARSTSVGPWERFELCLANGIHTIKSLHNNKFVSAEFGWSGIDNGTLRARATTVGPWEKFKLEGTVLRSAHNNKLVAAEFGWSGGANGILRVRSEVADKWEKFTVERIP